MASPRRLRRRPGAGIHARQKPALSGNRRAEELPHRVMNNYRAKDFKPFFHRRAFYTDDTVCTIAVADAHPLVLRAASYVTHLRGGEGAVREVCDLLLQANQALEQAQGASI